MMVSQPGSIRGRLPLRKLAALVLVPVAALVAACGGDNGNHPGLHAKDGGADAADAADGRSDRGGDQGDATADAGPKVACDPITQSPCGHTQACVVEQGETVCAEAGTLDTGAACGQMAGGGCRRGLVCAVPPGSSGTGMGPDGGAICLDVCDASQAIDSCPAGTTCSGVLEAFMGNARLCVATTECDLLDPTSCGKGQKCDLGPPPKTQCFPDGTLTEGAACGGPGQSCQAGLVCIAVGTDPETCRPVCDPAAATSSCAAGTTCKKLIDYAGRGVCAP
jgi:hypothetical protein